MTTRTIYTPRGVHAYIKTEDGRAFPVKRFGDKFSFRPTVSPSDYVAPPPPPPLKRPPSPKASATMASTLREEAERLTREAETLEQEMVSNTTPPSSVRLGRHSQLARASIRLTATSQ